MAERGGVPAARAVLQQCLQATLQVKPPEELSEAQYVQVRTFCYETRDIKSQRKLTLKKNGKIHEENVYYYIIIIFLIRIDDCASTLHI